jgi:hypothetical protein
MSNKKIPPPPALPPSNFGSKENYCLFHKGDIKGKEVYICPKCKTNYCMDCAKIAKSEGKKCIKCKQLIFL